MIRFVGEFEQHRPGRAEALQAHVALLASVTPDHPSRACRSAVGLSALDLMHERRVLEARRLLAYTEAGVADVARELGFSDPAYFSRFFSRRVGESPAAYRASLQSGQTARP